MRRLKRPFLSVTILFVASVGVALGSGYWLGALSVPQEHYEILEVEEHLWCEHTSVVRDDINNQWNMSFVLDNLGWENLTVAMVLLNRHHICGTRFNPSVFGDNATVMPRPPLTFKGPSGTYEKVNLDTKTITVTLKYGTLDFVSGSTAEIYFHTESGMDYLISVTLP